MNKSIFIIASFSFFLSACATSQTKEGYISYKHPTLGYSFDYPKDRMMTLDESERGNAMHIGGSANIGFSVTDPSARQLTPEELKALYQPVTIAGRSAFRHEGIGTAGNWFSENVVFCPSYPVVIQYSNTGRDAAYEAVLKDVLDSFVCK